MKRAGGFRGRFFLVFVGLFLGCSPREQGKILHLLGPDGRGVELVVEVADDEAERMRGLMFRRELPEGKGMLFIFPFPQQLSFWMKNTLIPLDILFFDHEGRLVSSHTMVPCEEDPCPLYPSLGPAQYALEIPEWSIGKWGVEEGWRLVLPKGV